MKQGRGFACGGGIDPLGSSVFYGQLRCFVAWRQNQATGTGIEDRSFWGMP